MFWLTWGLASWSLSLVLLSGSSYGRAKALLKARFGRWEQPTVVRKANIRWAHFRFHHQLEEVEDPSLHIRGHHTRFVAILPYIAYFRVLNTFYWMDYFFKDTKTVEEHLPKNSKNSISRKCKNYCWSKSNVFGDETYISLIQPNLWRIQFGIWRWDI